MDPYIPNILVVFNCVRQLKPSQLLRFHSSSEKYSCSNPLINVCLGDVSMETVFTAPQCSKNGSKVITVPESRAKMRRTMTTFDIVTSEI